MNVKDNAATSRTEGKNNSEGGKAKTMNKAMQSGAEVTMEDSLLIAGQEPATEQTTKDVALTTATPNALATQSTSQFQSIFEEYAGAGSENVGEEDVKIPLLKLIQAMSPELDDTSTKYIPGAKQGDFFNSLTRENYGSVIMAVPVMYDRSYIEFVPRSMGGGFVAKHGRSSGAKWEASMQTNSEGKTCLLKPNGNELVDTPEMFLIVVKDDGNHDLMSLPMNGSKIKVATSWNGQLKLIRLKRANGAGTFNPPYFSSIWKIESGTEKNNKGTFRNIKVSMLCKNEDADLISLGSSFYEMLKEGKARVQYDEPEEDVEFGGGVDGEGGADSEGDESFPFGENAGGAGTTGGPGSQRETVGAGGHTSTRQNPFA